MFNTLEDNRWIIVRRNVQTIRDADGKIIGQHLYHNGIVRRLSGFSRGYAVTLDPTNILILYFDSRQKAENYIETSRYCLYKIFYKNDMAPAYIAIQKKDLFLEHKITYHSVKKNIQTENFKLNRQFLSPTILESNKNYIKGMIFLKDKNTGLYVSINNGEISLSKKEDSTYFENNVQSNSILSRIDDMRYLSKYHDMDLVEVDNDDQPIKKTMRKEVKFNNIIKDTTPVIDEYYDIRKEEDRKLNEEINSYFKNLISVKDENVDKDEKESKSNNNAKKHIKVPANRETISVSDEMNQKNIKKSKSDNNEIVIEKKKNVNMISIKKLSLVERLNYAWSQKDKNKHYNGDKLLNSKRDSKGNLVEYTLGYAHKYINGVKIY